MNSSLSRFLRATLNLEFSIGHGAETPSMSGYHYSFKFELRGTCRAEGIYCLENKLIFLIISRYCYKIAVYYEFTLHFSSFFIFIYY